jgi:CRP-like cAMP-binding protein
MEPTSQRLAAFLDKLSQRDEIQRKLLQLPLEPTLLSQAAELFRTLDFQPGDLIIEESSQEMDTILFLVDGKADALVRPFTVEGRPGEPQVVGHSESLDVLGEIGLVMRTPRTATIRATTPVQALAIDRDSLAQLVQIHPALANGLVRWCAQNAAEKIGRTLWMHDEAYPIGVEVKTEQDPNAAAMLAPDFALADIERNYASQSAKTTKLVRERLQELRCFDWEKEEVTDEVAKLFQLVKVPAKRGILAEGELGESLLILSRGIANIRKRDGELVHGWVANHLRPVHTLLGEMAFLNPGARTGTVLAATACELLELEASAVPKLVACAPRLAQHLHLGLLKAVCPKLVDMSADRATVEAVARGDWEQWFVEDDYYTRKLKALDLK